MVGLILVCHMVNFDEGFGLSRMEKHLSCEISYPSFLWKKIITKARFVLMELNYFISSLEQQQQQTVTLLNNKKSTN